MSAVSETIVREFFESRGFLVRQHRKYVAPNLRDEEEIDFFIFNPQPLPSTTPLPFILDCAALAHIERAIVDVKGWHSGSFTSALIAKETEIVRFANPAHLRLAARFFGESGSLTKILVAPSLPSDPAVRDQSLEFLKSNGVDAVLPFRTALAELIGGVEPNRNYQKSDLLQVIRLLKHYDLIKESQMELFKGRGASVRPPRPRRTPKVAPPAPES